MAGTADLWPRRADYQNAVLYPRYNLRDPRLHATQVEANLHVGGVGMPSPNSGNFGAVYKLNGGQRSYALKVFAKAQHDRELRYGLIDRHLAAQPPSPTMVSFSYDPQGIKVNERWYPTLVMDWVTGRPLFKYVDEALQQRGKVENGLLCREWVDLMAGLAQRHIAHGDLQHGNVIVLPDGSLKLVDYDGMFVPAMRARSMMALEAGLPAYQHPRRAATPTYFDERLDHFSALVILLTFASLNRVRWQRYHTDDCLIISKNDVLHPDQSPLLGELTGGADQPIAKLARIVKRAAQGGLDDIPPFQLVVADGAIKELLNPSRHPGEGTGTRPPPPPVPPSPPPRIQLTPRERDVLDRVVTGLDDSRIALSLAIQPATVQGYVRSIQGKVGVATRRDLINWGAAHGYGQRLPIEPPLPPLPPPPPPPPPPLVPKKSPSGLAETLRWIAAIVVILGLHAWMDGHGVGTGRGASAPDNVTPSASEVVTALITPTPDLSMGAPTATPIVGGDATPIDLPAPLATLIAQQSATVTRPAVATVPAGAPAAATSTGRTIGATPPSRPTAAPGATVVARAPSVVPSAGASGTLVSRAWLEPNRQVQGTSFLVVHAAFQVAQTDSRQAWLIARLWMADGSPMAVTAGDAFALGGQVASWAIADVPYPVTNWPDYLLSVPTADLRAGQGSFATVDVIDIATQRVLARARSEGTFNRNASG